MQVQRGIISRNRTIVGFTLVLLVLFSRLSFFRPAFISDDLLKLMHYLVLGAVAVLFVQRTRFLNNSQVKRHFGVLIGVLLFDVFLTLFIAEIQWGQAWSATLISSLPVFSLILYYYAHSIDISRVEVEKIFQWLTVIYAICFCMALIVFPSKLFTGYGELEREIDTSRGFPRIRLTLMGLAPIFFSFFYLLARLKQKFTRSLAISLIVVFVLIILQLGRVPILIATFLGLWYFASDVSNVRKTLIALAFFVTLWVIYENVLVVKELVDYSINDYENSTETENVRIGSYRFYTLEFPNSWASIVFGNGQYSLGNGAFGDFVDKYGRSNGFIPADVGYAYIFLNYGILGIILFAIILYKAITIEVDNKYEYVKYYVIFLFLVNFSGNTILAGLPFLALSFYLLDQGCFIKSFKQRTHEKSIERNKRQGQEVS